MAVGSSSNSNETRVVFPDNRRLIELCGVHDQNLDKLERELQIQVARRGNRLILAGPSERRESGERALRSLYELLEFDRTIEPEDVDAAIRFETSSGKDAADEVKSRLVAGSEGVQIRTKRRTVEPRTAAQEEYVRALIENKMVFAIGPAGTGKTYLAVAVAVAMLLENQIDRIFLSRPAVEAGERLGFLPGDMREKVDPYMQPLYDALHGCMYGKQVARLIEERRIEIAPLAFMRGRTLSSAYILLDEAQNATSMQMRMFLTRLGVNSRMAITGDVTQIDLPRGVKSGLVEARQVLDGISGIVFKELTSADVVRDSLVTRIIDAYAADRSAS